MSGTSRRLIFHQTRYCMNRFLKPLDRLLQILSWISVLLILVSAITRTFRLAELAALQSLQKLLASSWGTTATAAAVGYLTNYIAIWLLFRPYEPHLAGWFQGVVPRNKVRLASSLGESILQYLLKPEKIAEHLGKIAKDFLHDKQMLEKLRLQAKELFAQNSAEIADFLIPYLEGIIAELIRQQFNAENIGKFSQDLVKEWFANPQNLERASLAIAKGLKNRAPELAEHIRKGIKQFARDYVEDECAKYPDFMQNLFTNIVSLAIDKFNWGKTPELLIKMLEKPENKMAISRELAVLIEEIPQYLRSKEESGELENFLKDKRSQLEEYFRSFVRDKVPGMVEEFLRRDEVWQLLEQRMLPAVQSFVLEQLEEKQELIVEKLELKKQLESSVLGLNMREMHEMINEVSGEHLLAIQVLGYVLGGICGWLLTLAA